MKELFESSYLSVMSEENDKLRKEIEILNNRVSELEKSVSRKEEQITNLDDENFDLENEIERLNNIINELEKWLDKKEKLTFNSWNKGIHEVQRKLQELKGNDKE